MKLLLGLTEPTAGQAWLLGAPIGDLAARRRIGYLPELFRYQGFLTAREVLGFHCELARLPRSTWKEEIAHRVSAYRAGSSSTYSSDEFLPSCERALRQYGFSSP